MSVFFAAPGVPMAIAGQGNTGLIRALAAPLAQAAAVSIDSFLGPFPSDITGLSGWWDAGMLGAILDYSGNRLANWNSTVGALADKSSMAAPPLVPFHLAVDVNPNPTLAVPRVNGFLGALGSPDLAVAQYAPTLDPDWGLVAPSLDFGSGSGWTLYFVWTRPNIRQGTIQVNSNPVSLVQLISSGTTLLQADSIGSNCLRVRSGTLSGITEPSDHESDGREQQKSARLAVEIFPVFGQSATPIEPGERSLHHPALG